MKLRFWKKEKPIVIPPPVTQLQKKTPDGWMNIDDFDDDSEGIYRRIVTDHTGRVWIYAV